MSAVPIVAELDEAAVSAAEADEADEAMTPVDGPARAQLRRRVVACGATTALLLAAGMLPPPPLPDEPWLVPGLVVVIVTVVALWGAAPLHRAALRDLRAATVSADVLASATVLAALGLALVTLALSAAGGGPMVPMGGPPSRIALGPVSLGSPGAVLLSVSPDAAAAVATAFLALRYLAHTAGGDAVAERCRSARDEPGSDSVRDRVGQRRGVGGLVAVGVVAGAGALGFWWAVVGPAGGVAAAVAVLVVTSPGPLGLARSAALQAGSSAADQLGVTVTDPAALARMRRVDVAVVDCTGTLTVGAPRLLRVATGADVGPERGLRIMASLLARSDDAVARAVVAVCQDHGLGLSSVEVQAHSGRQGVRGVVDGLDGPGAAGGPGAGVEPTRRVVTVGYEHFLRRWRLAIPPALEPLCAAAEAEGYHALLAGWDGEARVVVVVADPVRPTAVEAVEALRRARVRPVVLSGDPRSVVDAVASLVGIDQVAGEVEPDVKAEVVRRYRDKGRTVVVLGDPVHDADALAAADLGLTAGPAVWRYDLWAVVDVVRLRRRLRRTIRTNQALALAVPAVGLPLAVAGVLDPTFAAATMVLSASLVVLSSQRLRGLTTSRPPEHRRRGGTGSGQWAQAQDEPQGADGAIDPADAAGELEARPVAANTDSSRTASS